MNRSVRPLLAVTAMLAAAAPLGAQTFVGGTQPSMAGFGGAVAIVGDEILVGESGNQIRPGIVYVYSKEGGSWVEGAQLTASDAEPGDRFGSAIAGEGTTLIATGPEAVYVMERGAQGWTEAARVEMTGMDGGLQFGVSAAVSGDLALVSAVGQQGGTVYVLRRDGGDWSQVGSISAPDVGPSQFGLSVALDGTTALVGAPAANNRTGAVYTYEIDPMTGQATQGAPLSPPDGAGQEAFGVSVALAGDRVLVGAPLAAGQVGAVHVFARADEGWTRTGQLLPFDGEARFQFGVSVAQDGERVMVGAPAAGSAYLFQLGEMGVMSSEVVRSEAGGGFGVTLAFAEGVAAFGLPGVDNGLGQTAIFEPGGMGWTETGRVLSEAEGFDAVRGGQVDCSAEGEASAFGCQEVDLVSFVPNSELGAERGVGTNDVWGWMDPETGKEYALVGMLDQSSFVDISDPANPVLVGTLPLTEGANPAVWRDIKTYDNHAFIVSDGAGQHGMQVLDMTRFREFDGEPIEFTEDAVYHQVASVHNIVINEDAGFAYAVGARGGGETCGGGLHIIDIRDPKNPTFAGCFSDPQTGRSGTGYTHDAQCVNYEGPDEDYQGRFICFGANETALSIADVTDPSSTLALSRASYPNVGYSHQGWLTEDQRYFYMNDELDELQTEMPGTRTLIWDVTDLEDPQLVKEHFGTTTASDHNLYVVGDRMYQSNYQSGFRVLDIADPENPREVAYFDTVPYGTNTPGMGGSWSNYPFFESGVIIITSGNEGLFLVRSRDGRPIS